MIYKNIKTGARLTFKSEIQSPDWVPDEPAKEPDKETAAPEAKKRTRKSSKG